MGALALACRVAPVLVSFLLYSGAPISPDAGCTSNLDVAFLGSFCKWSSRIFRVVGSRIERRVCTCGM